MSTLPNEFVGKYINSDDPSQIIIIENTNGDFIEKGPDYTVTGTFQLSDISDKAKETFIQITGFEVKESNTKDGIHMIGLMDYTNCTSSFRLNDQNKPTIGLFCPKHGGLNQFYTKK
jgi:hypothetical protein